ncbi:AMP-binding protein [Chitinophaga flava]|nr:AMP-binding protein [Chitinophaga flava]
MEISIISCLITHAHNHPRKIAFTILSNEGVPPQDITYRELEMHVKQLAARLKEKQLKDKTALLVYQDMRAFIISFLACEYAGVIPVPVPYAKGGKQLLRINGIIADAGTGVILCTSDSVPHLEKELGAASDNGLLEFVATDDPYHALEDVPPSFTEISFIQYTSGSVGIPKGVVVTGNNLLHNEKLIQQTFGCDKDSVIFSWLPFHHDMGLIGNLLHTIYVGCSCVLMSPLHFMQKPKAWLEGIATYRVTHSGAPNFAYDFCVDRIPAEETKGLDLSSWKVAYNGSEPVHAATLARFARHFSSAGFNPNAFTPCYGLAEATLLTSGSRSSATPLIVHISKEMSAQGKIRLTDSGSDDAKAVVSSGRPADGMYVKIVSLSDQHECGELEEGEICIAGESVTSGYWNKDNRDIFYEFNEGKFLRTGDLGFLYQGELFVNGRVKEMLIVRGKNFYPYDIEQTIMGCHEAIETNGVAVFAIDESSVAVVAEVKRTHVNNVDGEAVVRAIEKLVTGEFGISLHDIVLTTPLGIPRTTSGKLQRIRCKTYYLDNIFKIIASKAALSDSTHRKEKNADLLTQVRHQASYATIRAYVADIIEIKTGGALPAGWNDDTDITTLGVDSLRAMEIINVINQELQLNLDATKIYEHNTLSTLCNAIEAMLWLKSDVTQNFGKEITI